MRALSLFSGIGGLDIAAESCGIETAAFCEIEAYAVQVLERRWPGVPIIDDVRKIRGCDWPVDVIHGGIPCQDLSVAGKQAGLEGERSGLWFEMLRVIAECRPAFVLAENVRGAVNLALDTVYSGLVGEGYKVYPYVIPASAVGAPHQRERLFVFGVRRDVADCASERLQRLWTTREQESEVHAGKIVPVCDSVRDGKLWPTPTSTERSGINPHTGRGGGLSNAVSLWPTPCSRGDNGGGPVGLAGGTRAKKKLDKYVGDDARKKLCSGSLNPAWVEILMGFPFGWTDIDCDEPELWQGWPALMGQDQYQYEPPRTTAGCKNRAKRLKCLGNAVVPQQAYPFFEGIAQIHNLTTPNVSRETLLNKK